ncbi:MAG: translation elongation factor 4 [Altererythrobacter sp.]
MTDLSKIRNFSIIAHIDHGKSTLADRLIQHCGGLTEREMSEQVLDNMDIEKERGITIKAQTVRLNYTARDGETYELNLMDTPGHVDFAYEVSRSLAACEGALLVVDAAQGVEAQTLANVYQSIEHDHEIVPVINKIDLPAAEPEQVRLEIEEIIGLDASEAVLTSAKSGIGIEETLEAIVAKIPHPTGDRDAPLKAMLVDSWYDPYLGVVILVRVIDGALKKGLNVKFMQGGTQHLVDRVGCFTPKRTDLPEIGPGEIGFITAQIKEVEQARVGDTITTVKNGAPEALKGYKEVQPVVFCGLFPVDAADFEKLRESIGKLRLNDASFSFEMESSAALGFGFRCGFLGLLHLEIIQERLSREYDLDLITTAPSVVYRIALGHTKNEDAKVIELHNPADYPDPSRIEEIEEPWIKATIYTPDEYLGAILKLCQDRRGIQTDLTYVGGRAQVTYETAAERGCVRLLRPAEEHLQRLCQLRLRTDRPARGDLVKMNILVNNEPVDALSLIVHRSVAEERGRGMCERLKDLIPRHLFKIPIQAAIGGKIIARETIAALRKDVTAKCYGGDITRKKKLLEKQKKGKARMREYGNVSIPQEAFIAALRMGEE